MIDLKKQYRTKGGYKVKLNFIDGETVYGHYERWENFWCAGEWNINDGSYSKTGDSECDLVEAKPRIKKTVWLNIYEYCFLCCSSKEEADHYDGDDRLACIKVEIDVEEGEGL
jgi:hypothetical protein